MPYRTLPNRTKPKQTLHHPTVPYQTKPQNSLMSCPGQEAIVKPIQLETFRALVASRQAQLEIQQNQQYLQFELD